MARNTVAGAKKLLAETAKKASEAAASKELTPKQGRKTIVEMRRGVTQLIDVLRSPDFVQRVKSRERDAEKREAAKKEVGRLILDLVDLQEYLTDLVIESFLSDMRKNERALRKAIKDMEQARQNLRAVTKALKAAQQVISLATKVLKFIP